MPLKWTRKWWASFWREPKCEDKNIIIFIKVGAVVVVVAW